MQTDVLQTHFIKRLELGNFRGYVVKYSRIVKENNIFNIIHPYRDCLITERMTKQLISLARKLQYQVF